MSKTSNVSTRVLFMSRKCDLINLSIAPHSLLKYRFTVIVVISSISKLKD